MELKVAYDSTLYVRSSIAGIIETPDHYFCSGGAGHLHLFAKAKTTLIPLITIPVLADRDLCGDLCFGV